MTDPKKCEYCDKRGVPIVPLRYAVAPAGAGAPKSEGPAIALPAAAAHYTRRLLRSGYLYVYDEARDRWDLYFVTPQAHYFKLANTPGVTPILPTKPFACPDEGHRAVASCITIPDAARATKVWLGFSDVQWTEATKAKHADEAYRKRHMRCVDVKDFAAGADAKHCLGVHTIGTHVAEHALDAKAASKALGWSPFAVDARKEQTARLIQECENLYKGKGFAVVLDDPTGVAAELDALMTRNLNLFMEQSSWKRQLAVSSAITQIEVAVREQAVVAEEQAAESLANQQISGNPLGHAYSERTRERTEKLRTVTPAEAKRAADHMWKKYAAKFDEPAAKMWRARFDKQLQDYDSKFIASLAEAHAAWMKSRPMANAFECNYDDTDADCGIVYARAVSACIGSSQDKAACFDLYADWLAGDVEKKSNLLLRALVLNLDKTAKEVKAAVTTNLDWRGFPIDGLVGNFSKATERIAEGKPDVLGHLLRAVAGPVAKLLAKGVDGVVRPGLVALALHNSGSWLVVEVKGTKADFRKVLVRELIRSSGQPLTPNQVKAAVNVQLKRLKVAGVNLDASETKRFLIVVDKQAAALVPSNLPAQQRAAALAKAITTPEDLERLTMGHWREQMVKPALKGSIPFVGGLLGALLQYNAMQKLAEDDTKAMSHEAQEATWRLGAGVAAFGGTVTELTGLALEKISGKLTLRLGKGLAWLGQVAQWLGKAAGMAGALVMAWWDLKKSEEAAADGQHGLKWAYRVSAGVGVAAAVMLLVGWTGVGLVLVVLLIGITLLIEYFKDNKIQDWLERCVWGMGPAARYPTLEEEQRQLKLAVS
jgi:hypothetical protein